MDSTLQSGLEAPAAYVLVAGTAGHFVLTGIVPLSSTYSPALIPGCKVHHQQQQIQDPHATQRSSHCKSCDVEVMSYA